MQSFKNILVGVDLTRCRQFDVSELSFSTREAINQAIGLAQLNSAPLLFFAVLPMSPTQLKQVRAGEPDSTPHTTEELANRLLAELVNQAKQHGVAARSNLVLGQPFQEIIELVKREGHDLVVAGIREQTWLSRMIFGNTSLALLHHCPCPVWIAKPGHAWPPQTILIVTDLKPAGEAALRLGLPLGRLLGSTIHLLHPVEYPLDFLWGPTTPDRQTRDYHARIRAEAERTLLQQLAVVDPKEQGAGVQIHLPDSVGAADATIQNFLQEHEVDLLVKGTVLRSGVEGLMLGNTAARLLPEVHCSVLALRPPSQP